MFSFVFLKTTVVPTFWSRFRKVTGWGKQHTDFWISRIFLFLTACRQKVLIPKIESLQKFNFSFLDSNFCLKMKNKQKNSHGSLTLLNFSISLISPSRFSLRWPGFQGISRGFREYSTLAQFYFWRFSTIFDDRPRRSWRRTFSIYLPFLKTKIIKFSLVLMILD